MVIRQHRSNHFHRRELSLTLAVIGDVHDLWDADDAIALEALGIDLALFVGDFGNESVAVVKAIAQLDLPKAAIMGNHDAWYSATEWGRKKCPYDRQTEDWVQEQLDLLGEAHVGYGKLDLPEFELSIVGGRPFSWGGSSWKNVGFYQDRYDVHNFEESTQKIVDAAQQTAYDTIIFIGHCGPTGLGDQAEAPCGKDWKPIGGDYGDPDLEAAIAQTRSLGKQIPLVAFGHMHHHLRHTQQRLREQLVTDDIGTIYLNAARVPRIQDTEAGRLRNFSLVSLEGHEVTQVSLVWLDSNFAVYSEEVLYQKNNPVAQFASS